MKKILSLALVVAMLFSMVAAIPLNASAGQTDVKKSTEVEAYYFGGKVTFKELYGNYNNASRLLYNREESIKKGGDSSKGTLVIDGVIEEKEWGAPVVVVDSQYAANNGGFTNKMNSVYEAPSAENTYFYYNPANYTEGARSPMTHGMKYNLYFMWDEEYLYIAADTVDVSQHTSSASNSSIWNADAFQFRVDKEGAYTTEDGYNAYGLNDLGERVINMPWRSSVYRGTNEFTTEVPNFVVSYSGGGSGGNFGTIIRDNANRYYPHIATVEQEGGTVEETQYADIELSYYVYKTVPESDGTSEYPYCATYEEYKAAGLKGQSPELMERGPAYATVKPVKQKDADGKNISVTQYEIAVPWSYIDADKDFAAEIGDKFGIATMLLDRQNNKDIGSYGAFLEWGNGINAHRANYDYKTCNGSNLLTLSATAYNEREAHEHNFAAATCSTPETCTTCGYQRGYNKGHVYELVSQQLPTTDAAGSAVAKCVDCGEIFERELAKAGDRVVKDFNRNDGVVDLSTELNGSFATVWRKVQWKKSDDGSWGFTEDKVENYPEVYNIDGANKDTTKNMLWLPGQIRPEVSSEHHTDVTSMVNPYDFTVLDLTCFSITGSYFMFEDFGVKNSTVSMEVDLWNRLEGDDELFEAERGYHDTLAFWFGPNSIEYLAGLFIVEDKVGEGDKAVITDTKYFFAITPNNSSELSIEEFKSTAFAYKEIDPSMIDMGQDTWNNMTFFVDYDANVALLFWDGELVVGEYDPHFTTTQSDVDPILRVFNLEMCITDFYAGEAALAADILKSVGGDSTDTETPESSDSESESESSEPESSDSEPVESEEPETSDSVSDTESAEPESSDSVSDTESAEPESSDSVSDTESSEPESSDSEPVESEEPEEPALGAIDNPYILEVAEGFPVKRLAVSLKPNETAWIQAKDAMGLVSMGATGANYMVAYGKMTFVYPAGIDNEAQLQLEGRDMFSVYNTSDTEDVVIYMFLEPGQNAGDNTGTWDNPEVIDFVTMPGMLSASKEFAAGSMEYWYKLVAPADGIASFNVSAYDAESNGVGYVYQVTNNTTGYTADLVMYDGNPDNWLDPTELEVNEGDELLLMVITYDPNNVRVAPAATVDIRATFSEVGTQDNPEVIVESGDYTANIKENSFGYTYEFIAEEDGKITVTMNSGNWSYSVNNLTSNKYGDTHCFNDDEVVASETIKVKAGDQIQIVVNTASADPEKPWEMPAGEINWTFTFEERGEFDGEGLLYTLSGALVDGKLEVQLNLESNEEGITYAWLKLPYNAEALQFVSAEGSNDVFTNIEVSNYNDGYNSFIAIVAEVRGEGDPVGYPVISTENGAVMTAVFEILDKDADFGFELVTVNDNENNHTVVDAMDCEIFYPVEFVFENDVDISSRLEIVGVDVEGKLHVYIDLKNNPGIWSLGFNLSYDADVLKLVETNYGDLFGDDEPMSSANNGVVYFANKSAIDADITTDGNVVELVFEVLDYDADDYGFELEVIPGNTINVAGEEVEIAVKYGTIEKVEPTTVTVTINGIEGEYVIGSTFEKHATLILHDTTTNKYYVFKNWTSDDVEIADPTAQDVAFVVPAYDVEITAERYLHGDVNGDGKVNAKDYMLLKKRILGEQNPDVDEATIDYNFDGKLNAKDYMTLKKAVLGTAFDYSELEVEVVSSN